MTTTSETKVFTDLSPMTSANIVTTPVTSSLESICTQPSLMFSSTAYSNMPAAANNTATIYSQTVTTPSSEALPLNIPKCVFTAVPMTLSPASSVDSLDSSTSSLGSAHSEHEYPQGRHLLLLKKCYIIQWCNVFTMFLCLLKGFQK